jgi:cytochrome c oxidase subunit II
MRHVTQCLQGQNGEKTLKPLARISLLMLMAGFVAVGSYSSGKNAPRAQTQAQAADQNVQVIDVSAKKYEYTPSTIHVKKGTKVQLRITATDHQHGFKINVYPDGGNTKGAPGLVFTTPKDCWTIPKGQTVTIEFEAKTAGSYPFKCCKFCGFGHMGMKGTIVVDE